MSGIGEVAIQCGGLGSRLTSLTEHTAKSLPPVGGMPAPDRLLFGAARFSFRCIILLDHIRHGQIAAFTAPSQEPLALGLNPPVEVEPGQIGTAGALLRVRARPTDEFPLLNDDTPLGLNFHTQSALWRAQNAAAAIGRHEVGGPRSIMFDMLRFQESLEEDSSPLFAGQGELVSIATDGYFLEIDTPPMFERTEILAVRRRTGRSSIATRPSISTSSAPPSGWSGSRQLGERYGSQARADATCWG